MLCLAVGWRSWMSSANRFRRAFAAAHVLVVVLVSPRIKRTMRMKRRRSLCIRLVHLHNYTVSRWLALSSNCLQRAIMHHSLAPADLDRAPVSSPSHQPCHPCVCSTASVSSLSTVFHRFTYYLGLRYTCAGQEDACSPGEEGRCCCCEGDSMPCLHRSDVSVGSSRTKCHDLPVRWIVVECRYNWSLLAFSPLLLRPLTFVLFYLSHPGCVHQAQEGRG
jgi:hypothetical protein